MTSRDDRPSTSAQPQSPETEEQPEGAQTSPSESNGSSHESVTEHPLTSPFDTQSVITVHSRVRPTGDEESEFRGGSIDQGGSSGSLTFPHPLERTPSDNDPQGQPSTPTSPSRQSVVEPSEIIPETASEEAASSVSFRHNVPSPSPNSRKRRRFWSNLKRSGEQLRKRLCCCLQPVSQEVVDEGSFRIKQVEMTEGIVRSKVTMDSLTCREVENVVTAHGSLVIFTGERLEGYRQRMEEMLTSNFDRRRGYEILDMWKMQGLRPSRLHVEMLPSSSTERRSLTLGDVRLLHQAQDAYERRDDAIFRYFMSYVGLSDRMLIPSRG